VEWGWGVFTIVATGRLRPLLGRGEASRLSDTPLVLIEGSHASRPREDQAWLSSSSATGSLCGPEITPTSGMHLASW